LEGELLKNELRTNYKDIFWSAQGATTISVLSNWLKFWGNWEYRKKP